MFVSTFKTRFKPKLEVPAGSIESSSIQQETDENSPEYSTADDSKPPSIDTKRVHDRDGGDFYISY